LRDKVRIRDGYCVREAGVGVVLFALTFPSAGATPHFTSPRLTNGPTNGVSAPSTDSPSPKHRARSSSSILLTKLTQFAQHSHLCLLNTHVYQSISSSSQDADHRPLPHPLERSRLRSSYCTYHPLHSHQSSTKSFCRLTLTTTNRRIDEYMISPN